MVGTEGASSQQPTASLQSTSSHRRRLGRDLHPGEPSDETAPLVDTGLSERKRVLESHALHTVP